MTLVSPGYIVV